jgi:hypothetical protein
MKHYPAAALDVHAENGPQVSDLLTDTELAQALLERTRRRPLDGSLLTEAEVAREIAARLDGKNGEQGRLANDLGIAQSTLSSLLSGRYPIGEDLARRLGFRRVTRFERIAPAAPHTNPAALAKFDERVS